MKNKVLFQILKAANWVAARCVLAIDSGLSLQARRRKELVIKAFRKASLSIEYSGAPEALIWDELAGLTNEELEKIVRNK